MGGGGLITPLPPAFPIEGYRQDGPRKINLALPIADTAPPLRSDPPIFSFHNSLDQKSESYPVGKQHSGLAHGRVVLSWYRGDSCTAGFLPPGGHTDPVAFTARAWFGIPKLRKMRSSAKHTEINLDSKCKIAINFAAKILGFGSSFKPGGLLPYVTFDPLMTHHMQKNFKGFFSASMGIPRIFSFPRILSMCMNYKQLVR